MIRASSSFYNFGKILTRKSLFFYLQILQDNLLKWDYCYSLQFFPCRASLSFYNFGKILTQKSQFSKESFFYLQILQDNLLILVKMGLFSTVFSLSSFFIFLQFWENFDSKESFFYLQILWDNLLILVKKGLSLFSTIFFFLENIHFFIILFNAVFSFSISHGILFIRN